MSTSSQLACSFCGKAQGDVASLVAGPTVYICDECVETALARVLDGMRSAAGDRQARLASKLAEANARSALDALVHEISSSVLRRLKDEGLVGRAVETLIAPLASEQAPETPTELAQKYE